MRLDNEHEHDETGWTPPMAHEFSTAAPVDAGDDAPDPAESALAPVDPVVESTPGWNVGDAPHFEDAPLAVPQEFAPVTADDFPRNEVNDLSDLNDLTDTPPSYSDTKFPDLTAESIDAAEPAALAASVESVAAESEPTPEMDEEARRRMLGEKVPSEWVRVYGAEKAQRLRLLSRKIEKIPEAPVNYVLRGELYLSVNEYERAAADFRQALALAEALDPELDWGYINAAYIDRAHEGLRQAT